MSVPWRGPTAVMKATGACLMPMLSVGVVLLLYVMVLNLGSLRTMEAIDYPSPGTVAAQPVLFL